VRYILSVILAVCTVCFSAHFALAEKRVALVIGNSAYQNVPRLTNPVRDAAAIGDMFRVAKFDVVEARRDLGIVEMRRVMRDFSDKSRDADISVVYFAGHGIEVEGINYLIPVDAVLERDRDAFDEAIQLDRVLQAVEPAKRMRLIILDACRDNPFQRTMKRTIASRTLERGLSTVEPTKPNTLIAFAAKSGSTADDGNGANSPFTTALLKHLPIPGLDLRKAFGLVRDDVMKATHDKQEPFVYGSLGGNDVSLVPATATSEAANQPADVRRDYELAERIGTPDAWDTFLKQYPAGLYSDFAKAQLRKLLAEDARLSTTEKARQVEAEKARLAAAGAKTADQARAARETKAAEEARVAAEKKKLAEQAKAEAAERARAAAEKAASDKLAKENADAEAMVAEAARKAAEKAQAEKIKLAALEQKKAADTETAEARAAKDAASKPPATDANTPHDNPARVAALPSSPEKITMTPQQVARSLQTELRRVGCQTGEPGDDWTAASRRALGLFNKHTGLKFDVKVASVDVLDAVRGKTTRICPLICDHGFRPDGESCVKIMCNAGTFLNDDNECEKRREREKVDTKREKLPAVPPNPEKKESSRSQNAGSCSRMHDQLGCSCALKSGGYIYAGPQGPRWRYADYNAHISCLYAAGRR
jgi:uncharacterized caspase-like protein